MTLSEKQQVFTRNIGRLIEWCYANGYGVTLGEAWRDPRIAVLDAMEGKGIVKTLHTRRLAVDFNLFRGGVYLTKSEDYKQAGEYWKTLHELNVWGGDFDKLKDGNHFAMTHDGVK